MTRTKPVEKMLKSEMIKYIHELLEKIEDFYWIACDILGVEA